MDENGAHTFEKRSLVEELKLKIQRSAIFFTFSISAQPLGGTFQILLHHFHLWAVDQKSVIQIFERWCINRIMKQNIQKVLIFGSYP